MAKNKSSFEGQELAPMEPWRPEYAPQSVSNGRHPASTIVAFVLAAGFGLSIGGAFASQAGLTAGLALNPRRRRTGVCPPQRLPCSCGHRPGGPLTR